MEIEINEPCLVSTGQGFSVKYKDKLLYSKYSPERSILNVLQNTLILEDSLVLCISPVLSYGLKALLEKLPENCCVFAIELDERLYSFSLKNNDFLKNRHGNFYYFSPDDSRIIFKKINDYINEGESKFKRVVRMDFSASVQFYKAEYERIFETCQNVINQFWKNRLTLIKFARKFNSNLIKNLKLIPNSTGFIKTSMPILIVGAGESALETLKSIKKIKTQFFIICVDAALKTMKSLKLRPNAVICEESQSLISGAFTGCKDYFDFLFLSTSSNSIVAKLCPEKNIFYTSMFSNGTFLKTLISQKIITTPIDPLGSVGLSAVEISLKIRKSNDVPVFITGLDFSYSSGKTHVACSFHDNLRRIKTDKLLGIEFYAAAFSGNSIKTTGKNNESVYTTKNLSSYQMLFIDRFKGVRNLFDLGKTGLPLQIPFIEIDESSTISELKLNEQKSIETFKCNINENIIEKVYCKELNALLELKDILTGNSKLNEEERNTRILEIIKPRDYLYLHFPDGYKTDTSLGFLKRIRSELDYFIKLFSSKC